MANKNKISSQNNFYWIYLVGFFLVVLQIINVFPLWSDPADWGKAIFSRIIISAMLFLYLWQVIFKKIDFSYIKSKIKSAGSPLYLLVLLLAVYLLATILSVNWHFSLWGNPSRAGGFVSFSFYIILGILAFLIIKERDWKKILDFLITISLFVCLIAIFQQFGIFSKYIIPVVSRPVSTIGNPILLSIYLLLVTFFTFAFGLIEKSAYKKIFYFFSVLLFLFVSIFIVQTRGTYLGLLIGFLWFLFAYPNLNLRVKKVKVYAIIFLLILLSGMYLSKTYLDSHLYIYEKIPSPLNSTIDRALSIFEGPKITEARTSAWRVSWVALKEKPIFGYGPENFMIAFDKHYDPSLPKIGQIAPGEEVTEWFDRAHNFIFDVSVTAGIPALMIYLLFFGFLIWRLQKAKYTNRSPSTPIHSAPENANGQMLIYSQNALVYHGLQATFIGYLVALLSSFDSVSTYLVSFLLIGYSLHLIITTNANMYVSQQSNFQAIEKLHKYRVPIISLLFVVLVWFLWVCNLKPFYINKQMNEAILYANLEKEIRCERAFNIMNTTYPSIPNSIINDYLAQRSTFIIYRCINHLKKQESEKLISQNIQILKDSIEKNPQYVTNWILAGEYIGSLIKEKNKLTENVFIETEETKKLKGDADYYFENALQLSPKRQLILKDWANVNIITADYQKAEEKLQKCIELNPSYASCYWYMALNKGYQKDYEGFNNFREIAKKNNYGVELIDSLQELINMYIRNNDYNGLAETYPKLIPLTSDPLEKAQLHASLADTYRNLGDIQKAREEVLEILDIIPLLPKDLQGPAKKDVEYFLEILK